MKKSLVFTALTVSVLFLAATAFAGGECPQARKTAAAPGNIAGMDETAKADAEKGKALYEKDAKPMACKQCHGDAGDGTGKLGAALTPKPRNFTCAETMKAVSPGQMFFIIKNGSTGTGMAPMKLTDPEIWDVVKYVRSTFVK
jgi:mono/diheme cytochrome c family protein